MDTKRIFLICMCFLGGILNAVFAQSNTLGKQIYGGSYTAPVVYKEYKVFSEGYKPPERQSFSIIKSSYTATSSSSVSSGKSSDNTVDRSIPRGKTFFISDDKGFFMGYKDGYGNIVMPAIYTVLADLHPQSNFENYLLVELSGKFGVFWAGDKNPTIPIIYDEIKPISYSTMLVKSGGLSGIVNISKPGKSSVDVPVIYEDLGNLDAYAVWTKSKNKFGLTDRDHSTILKTEYDEINVFSPQTVVVKKNGKSGLMNYKGNTVLPIAYESISKVNSGVAWIIQDGKWGLISQEGKILTPPQFDTVYEGIDGKLWINDLAVVNKGGKINYLNIRGEVKDYTEATATAAANYGKNNLYEDFSIQGGRYKWYLPTYSSFIKIAGGAYVVDGTSAVKVGGMDIPFPDEFAYQAGVDWELEISASKTGGGVTSDYGFSWGSRKGDNKVVIGKYGAYIPYSVDFKVKGGTNKIKYAHIGNKTFFYYNGKLESTGDRQSSGSGKFWFSVSNSATGLPYTVYYDDVRFTILEKK